MFIVTARNFETVCANLHLQPEHIRGCSVLSVGEGLSDFGFTLQQQYGATVTVIDPAYEWINPDTPLEQADQILKNHQVGFLGGLTNSWDKEREANKLFDRALPSVMKGSVLNLPFPDQSFDLITANRLLETVPMVQALTEMLRVIKRTGEIRIGQPFSVWIEESIGPYTSFLLQRNDDFDMLPEAENWQSLLDVHTGLQVCVITQGHPHGGSEHLQARALSLRWEDTPIRVVPHPAFTDANDETCHCFRFPPQARIPDTELPIDFQGALIYKLLPHTLEIV